MTLQTVSAGLLLAAVALLISSALLSRRQRTRDHELLRERAARLVAVVNAAPDGVLVSDAHNRIEFVNARLLELSGHERSELIGKQVEELLPEQLRARHARHHETYFRDPRVRRMGETSNISLRTEDGREIPVEICLSPVEIDGATHVVSIVRDVREQRALADRVRRLAFYDSLTDLPNRNLFQSRLEKSLEAAERRGLGLAVLFVDLDFFKHINDVFGHDGGDQLLRTVAERMVTCLRSGDGVGRAVVEEASASVSRIGGDEFIVLLSTLRDPEDAAKVAERLLDRLAEPVLIGGQEARTGASIGVSIYPRDGSDAETLVRCADAAMYQAKTSGRHCYRFFGAELNEAAMRKHRVALRLRAALEAERLQLHYQPLISARTGRSTGAEALLRWEDEELGPIAPSEFIAVAEDTGLVLELGDWVLRRACRQIREWREAGHRPPPVSINVSAKQLQQPSFPASVAAALHAQQLATDDLRLEITETALLSEGVLAMTNLAELRSMGVKVVLDDFGTGFSSLTHLVRLPISGVKIDRAFVAGVVEDDRTAAVVSGLSALVQRLGLSVTAEGVESEPQLRFLVANGCDDFQGYLVGPAVAPEVFVKWIEYERPAA